MSINIRKSVIFDPENNDVSGSSNQMKKKAQIPKLILTQMNINQHEESLSQCQSSKLSKPSSFSNKSAQIKIRINPNSRQSQPQPQINVIWAEEQKRFQRQAELLADLLKSKQQIQAFERKILLLQSHIDQLNKNYSEQIVKNKELTQKLTFLAQEKHATEKLYELQKINHKMEHDMKIYEVQIHQLKIENANLKDKEILLQKLLIQHQSLKMRCQSYQQNNEKYKQQIANMRKGLRDFSNDFYSQGKKATTKRQQLQQLMSMTQQKMQFIEGKVNQFQDFYFNQQLRTYEIQKNQAIVKFGKHLTNEIQRITLAAQTLTLAQRNQLIQNVKKQNQAGLSHELAEIQRKINQFKDRIKQTKLFRETKTIRQRVRDIESKITQLTHSQFVSSQSFTNQKQSAQLIQLRKKLQQKQSQILQLKGFSTKSYMPDNQQKYTIQISGTGSGSSNLILKRNFQNDYKASSIPSLSQKEGVSVKSEYDDGTPVPTFSEWSSMKTELKNLDRMYKALDEQLIHFRVSYDKVNSNNNILYQQSIKWKKKYESIAIDLQRFKQLNKSQYEHLETISQAKIKDLANQCEAIKKQNEKFQSRVKKLQIQRLSLKRNNCQLVEEVQNLRKELNFKQLKHEADMCSVDGRITQKMGQHLAYTLKLEQQIERKNGILEKQLIQNLNMTKKIEQNDEKVTKLQLNIKNLTLSLAQKSNQIQNLNIKMSELKNKIQELESQLKDKKLRIKKAQQNLSTQIAQKRAEISAIKKQNKKLESKIDFLKEKFQRDMQKKEKKYKKLQAKFIGLQEQNKSLKESLKLSRSLSLKSSVRSKSGQDKIIQHLANDNSNPFTDSFD